MMHRWKDSQPVERVKNLASKLSIVRIIAVRFYIFAREHVHHSQLGIIDKEEI